MRHEAEISEDESSHGGGIFLLNLMITRCVQTKENSAGETIAERNAASHIINQ